MVLSGGELVGRDQRVREEFPRRVLPDHIKVPVALRIRKEPHDVGWLLHRAIGQLP
jgi:hypothetical protein